jgi:hypothetical protein
MHGSRFAAQIKNNDEEALDRFRSCVEAGRIYGPYFDPSRIKDDKPFWMWVAHNAEAMHVMSSIAPWLTERRLLQLELTLSRVAGHWRLRADEVADWAHRVRTELGRG